MPVIQGLLRVKNEARWIERAVASIQPVCDSILVLDDHSTDDTPAICERMGCTVVPNPHTVLNETADKNLLLDLVSARKPDWVLMIDGDEALEPAGAEIVKAATAQMLQCAYSFRVLYLWNSENQVRIDGVYGRFSRPSLWRFHPGQRFKSTGNGGNFHCGNIPVGLRVLPIDAAILHYGYMLREDRIRKYEFYNRIDPHDVVENEYKHVVVGDLFPADSRFVHAGPLKLEALNV